MEASLSGLNERYIDRLSDLVFVGSNAAKGETSEMLLNSSRSSSSLVQSASVKGETSEMLLNSSRSSIRFFKFAKGEISRILLD